MELNLQLAWGMNSTVRVKMGYAVVFLAVFEADTATFRVWSSTLFYLTRHLERWNTYSEHGEDFCS